jgi:hypothetical protein
MYSERMIVYKMIIATSSYGCCALAWQNPRSVGVCLPFFLVLFFGQAKKTNKANTPKAPILKK